MASIVVKNYKLIYFNIRALGECLRWQFVAAKVPFTEETIPRENWNQLKHKYTWAQLPVLSVNNNEFQITQSAAIGRFLAKQFKMNGQTELESIRCDELVAALQDIFIAYRMWARHSAPWFPNHNLTLRQEAETRLLKEIYPQYFSSINNFITKYGNSEQGHAVGNSLTWSDLWLANFLDIYTTKFGDEIIKEFPRLQKQMNLVLNLPTIKERRQKRPESWT